jgi:hypothetical protein
VEQHFILRGSGIKAWAAKGGELGQFELINVFVNSEKYFLPYLLHFSKVQLSLLFATIVTFVP